MCVLGQEIESEYAVSPSTPLLSTAIDENGWVCGECGEKQTFRETCSETCATVEGC